MMAPRDIAATYARGAGRLVLGTGATAQSVARWLRRTGGTAVFADTRADADGGPIRSVLPDAPVVLSATAEVLDGAAEIIASPGIPDNDPLLLAARERAIPVHSDVAVFCRKAAAPIVAVTGTNGKSTVVSLLAHMCQQAKLPFVAGGNLGTPVLDLPTLPAGGVYVLELSSFQLQRTSNLDAQCACVLNIEPDHLDWHGDFSAYREAKLSVYRRCAYAVLPAALAVPERLIDKQAVQITFGDRPPEGSHSVGVVQVGGVPWWAMGRERIMPVADAALAGSHNILNVAAAFAIGTSIDLPLSAMIEAVRSFPGLAHRHQLVTTRAGVRFIDDSKATNCAAALAAAAAVDGPVVLLAGGLGKGEDYAAFAVALPDHVRVAIVYGELGDALEHALVTNGRSCVRVADLPAAVREARHLAVSGDTVLLAPAAASQDAYVDYKERGQHFCRLVAEGDS